MTDKATLAEIKEYMSEGREHRVDTAEKLATIATKLAIIEAERGDHGKRLTSLETSRSNFFAVAASWAAAIPLLSGFVSWMATKHT